MIGDTELLQYILYHLIFNAVKHNKEYGKIILKVIFPEEIKDEQLFNLTFVIEDSGYGMSKQVI